MSIALESLVDPEAYDELIHEVVRAALARWGRPAIAAKLEGTK